MAALFGKALLNVRRMVLRRSRSYDLSTSEGRAQERHRRVALSAAAAAAAKLVSVAAALVSVPLTLHYLGAERYGMWMTMSSLIIVASFADLGMANGVLNAVAHAHGRDDRIEIRAVVSSGFLVLSLIAATILFLFAVAYSFVPWSTIFNVRTDMARREAGPALAAFIACFALSMPVNIVQRVQTGLQQGFAASLWQGAGNVFGLLGLLIVIHFEGGLRWLVLALVGGPLFASASNNFLFFGIMRRDLAPRMQSVSWPTMASIARTGLLFFVLQFAMTVTFTSDNIVIAQLIGATAVTTYAIPEKMFSLISVVLGMLLFPLWPAYGEAIARGDFGWVRRTVIHSLLAAMGAAAVLSSILVIFGSRILALWVGRTVDPPLMLLLGLGLWKVVEGGGNSVSMALNGANVIRFQVLIAAFVAPLAVALKLVLIGRMGISGVVWATILANLCGAVPTCFFMRRWLYDRSRLSMSERGPGI